VDFDSAPNRSIRQAFQVKAPVDFGEEAGRAIVSALDYVQRYIR
jgi:hypothetical protein